MERAFFGALDVVLSKLCYFLSKLCYSKCFSLCSFAEFNDRIMVTRIKTISAIIFSLVSALCANAQMPDFSGSISLKTPGNPAETFSLDGPLSGELSAAADLPLSITRKTYEKDDAVVVELTIQNRFDEPVPMYDSDFQLYWGEYAQDQWALPLEPYCSEQLPQEYSLAVGETREGALVYQVPDSACDFTLAFLEVFDNGTPEGEEGDVYLAYFTTS